MKVSEKLKLIAEDFLTSGNNKEDILACLNLACMAWNFSQDENPERELKRYIRSVSKSAPTKEALKNLEDEMRRIIVKRLELFPDERAIIIDAELSGECENFTIRVKFVR